MFSGREEEMRQIKPVILAIGICLVVQFAQAQWEPVQRLTWNSGASMRPRAVVDSSGGVHVVWYDSTPGNEEIYYKRSTDGGGAWATSKRVTYTAGSSIGPDIAVDSSGKLYVVWEDKTPGNSEIYFKKSTDKGTTWSANKRVTWTDGISMASSVAVDSSNRLHLVWDEFTSGNFEIFYKKSTDGGATWSTSKNLSSTSGNSVNAAMVVNSPDTIHVVWYDFAPGNFELYYKKSTNGGSSWSAKKRITWNSGASTFPAIVVDPSGNLHVAWSDATSGSAEIYYKKSTDGGATWTAGKALATNSVESTTPDLTVDISGHLHLVWSADSPYTSEIYYRKSTDKGATWAAAQRLTWNSGDSQVPVIAVYGSANIHVFWYDDTPGNYEIYYKRQK
jgi:BNR repeat-like domain